MDLPWIFPVNGEKNVAMAMSGSVANGRRSLDLQCLDGSFFGALQLSVCVTWINDLANPRCARWGLENWTLTPN